MTITTRVTNLKATEAGKDSVYRDSAIRTLAIIRSIADGTADLSDDDVECELEMFDARTRNDKGQLMLSDAEMAELKSAL